MKIVQMNVRCLVLTASIASELLCLALAWSAVLRCAVLSKLIMNVDL